MKKKIAIVSGIVIIAVLLIEVAVLRHRLSCITVHPCVKASFAAKVIENHSSYLLVEHISRDDVNYRDLSTVSLKEKDPKGIVSDASGNQIGLDQVAVGENVVVFYDGVVLEMYPGRIPGAVLIRIIE